MTPRGLSVDTHTNRYTCGRILMRVSTSFGSVWARQEVIAEFSVEEPLPGSTSLSNEGAQSRTMPKSISHHVHTAFNLSLVEDG
jgi:hypothetical protein